MHPSVDQLWQNDAEARAHLSACQMCREKLAEAKHIDTALKGLPTIDAPDQWSAIAVQARQSNSRYYAAAAVAVSLLALFTLVNLGQFRFSSDSNTPTVSRLEAAAQDVSQDAANTAIDWQQKSLLLESQLSALQRQLPTVVRADQIDAMFDLKASIDWVDWQLKQGLGESTLSNEQLWRDRSELMQALVSINRAEVQRSPQYFYDQATFRSL